MGYRCLLQMWTVRTFCKGMSIVSLQQWVSYNGTSTELFSGGRGQDQRGAPSRGSTPSSRPSVLAGRGQPPRGPPGRPMT